MSRAVMRATIRERLRSPQRLLLTAFFALAPLVSLVRHPERGFQTIDDTVVIAWIMAAGLIGRDVSSGSIQLILTRSISRTRYVVSKWIACSLLTLALVIAQLLLGLLALVSAGHRPALADAAGFLLIAMLQAFGVTSVVTLGSAWLAGFGDLAFVLVGFVLSGLLNQLGDWRSWHWMMRFGDEIGRFMVPNVDVPALLSNNPAGWLSLLSYASTVTLSVALAIAILNRKELSYASSDA